MQGDIGPTGLSVGSPSASFGSWSDLGIVRAVRAMRAMRVRGVLVTYMDSICCGPLSGRDGQGQRSDPGQWFSWSGEKRTSQWKSRRKEN